MAASFWERARGFFGRKDGINSTLELFREIYGGRASRSGVAITVQRALEVATVLACVRVLANGVSQVPFKLLHEVNGRRKPATDHPIYRLLYRRPNDWQTAFEFRETLMFHAALTGNAYIFLNRVGRARTIKEMILIEPGLVTVQRANDYKLTYKVRTADGAEQVFPAEAIWHVRGPSWNSWTGLEAVKLARDALGLTISLEDQQADFQKGGAKTSGLLSIDDDIGPEKYDQLAAWLDKYASDGDRVGKPMILDKGAKFTSMVMSAVDAQTLESRQHQVGEVCRIFGVMPLMVGMADKTATYASAEQFFLAHVIHTLTPWYERLEHSADVNLLTPQELDDGYYTKFNANALMRGASADRANYFKAALGVGGGKGWMTQNEVRDLEDQDRSDDPEADQLPQPPAPPKPSKSGEDQVPPPVDE